MMFIKKWLLYYSLVSLVVYGEKIKDEDRPYEFSFTIDSEQHRYEKKDINGIIQGEFGFITADGVYHVTVYATDENGNFKIISMKNIKISERLDQINRTELDHKPVNQYATTPTQHYELTKTSTQSTTVTPKPLRLDQINRTEFDHKPVNQYATTPTQHYELTKASTQSTTVTPKPLPEFITASTIRMGCGGCGIIATPTYPLRLFTSNQVENKPKYPNTISKPETSSIIKPHEVHSDSKPNPLNIPSIKPDLKESLPVRANNVNTIPTENNVQINQLSKYSLNMSSEISTGKVGVIISENDSTTIQDGYVNTHRLPASDPFLHTPLQYPSNRSSKAFLNNSDIQYREKEVTPIQSKNITNTLSNNTPVSIPPVNYSLDISSKAKIENGVIKVSGHDPIPIQDKYPNMMDGLPNGITKEDVSDLLYKFNYTVGFHGHHEKGWRNGTKVGGYFVNGRDGYSRIVTYVADELGYHAKFKLVRLGLDSLGTPKADTEKTFGLQNFEFVWYPIK